MPDQAIPQNSSNQPLRFGWYSEEARGHTSWSAAVFTSSGIYVAIGAVWLLMLFLARFHRPRDIAFAAVAFLLVPGPPRLPSAPLDIAVVLVGQFVMLAIAFRAVRGQKAL